MRELSLLLSSPDELFEGPPPGRDVGSATGASDWDHVGSTLGEEGVIRLLRLLQAHSEATTIVLRFTGGSDGNSPCTHTDADAVIRRLHAWCRARIASNREMIRLSRRMGARVLGVCISVLGVLLALAWALQQDSLLGPPGPVRTLAAEAMVIAGWVVMWRPIELVVFDPIRPGFECRLLSRALQMPVRVELLDPARDAWDSAGDAAVRPPPHSEDLKPGGR
jgi:hypothetical protein